MENMRFAEPQKFEYLMSLTDSDIATDLIHPLMEKLGFSFVRELSTDPPILLFHNETTLGGEYTALCFCKGNVSKSPDGEKRLAQINDGISAALKHEIRDGSKRVTPIRAIVVATGTISNSAVDELQKEFGAFRVLTWGRTELLKLIDEHMAILWSNVDIHKHEYLKQLAEQLTADAIPAQVADGKTNEVFLNAATDARYVELSAYRTIQRAKKRSGKTELVQDIEEISVLDLYKRPETLVLLIGDAGSGKSTALRRIAYVLAQLGLNSGNPANIPIYLRAPDILNVGCPTLVECASALCMLGSARAVPFDQEDFEKGRVVFLIDALDEIASDAERRKIVAQAAAFNAGFPKCRVILASRNYASLADMPGYNLFRRFTIQDISLRQAEKLAANLAKAADDKDWETKAANVLQRIQDVHGMGLNPLLVAVFVSTADDERPDIPANITELFKKWTELMLGRWERSKTASKQYQHGVKDFILKEIAFAMHKRGDRSISHDEFNETIANLLRDRGLSADIEELSNELLHRSGLLRIYPTTIEFRHHMIQEFFAGRGIPNSEFVNEVISDEWWRTPIIFYFGEHAGQGAALRDVFAKIDSMTGEQAFDAAITLGLALQACYLAENTDRKDVFRKVIYTFAECEEDVLHLVDDADRFKNLAIAFYLFVGRDAVALTALHEFADDLINEAQSREVGARDAIVFWIIVGLIETYQFEKAEHLIKTFRPKDTRLLLAIDMACSLIEKLRKIGKRHKNALREIREQLAERTESVRRELQKEFQVRLQEERQIRIDEGRRRRFEEAMKAHSEGDQPREEDSLSMKGPHPE